jgi:hypothetical protein
MFVEFYVAFATKDLKSALIRLCPLMILIIGTTTSNIIFCLILTLFLIHKHGLLFVIFSKQTMPWWLVSITSLCLGVIIFIYQRWERLTNTDNFTLRWLNYRLIEQPLDAIFYTVSSFFYPLVAPSPSHSGEHIKAVHLCLEPWGISQITWFYGGAMLCLGGLYFIAIKQILKVTEYRSVLIVALLWVLFNCLFHNMWGDEFFLYTVHWSFSLMIVLFFAAIKLSSKNLFFLLMPIYTNQFYFYFVSNEVVYSIYGAK